MKGALIVGIDNYHAPGKLNGCVSDAKALADLLKVNSNGTMNFSVILKTDIPTRAELRAAIIKLFQAEIETALFYFAGHGLITDRGGFIVTPDFRNYDEGISMDEVLNIVNQSPVRNKVVILDCCHSGAFGHPVIIGAKASYLAEGVTIITAARSGEAALEMKGHGMFTSLLLKALEGGAADLSGDITAAAVYTYIDRALGFWQQRPQFKTNVQRFDSLRTVNPFVPVLKNIAVYFITPDTNLQLDPSYEHTNTGVAVDKHVAIFKNLQQMHKAGLVEPVDEEYMYNVAMNSKCCRLTPLGQYYWELIKEEKI